MRHLIWMIALLLTGCLRPTQSVMEDVNPYGWHKDVRVDFENGDTTTRRDLRIVIRSNRNFKADSLHLELTLIDPDSAHYTERVAFAMQHRRVPAALHLTHELPYRRQVILPRLGKYAIQIHPLDPIEGLEAIGINIVKSEEPEK